MVKKLLRKYLPQKIINNSYHLSQAILGNLIWGFPSRKMTVIGVTGTDGKTTTVNMIYQILKDAGKKVSMVSTIKAVINGQAHQMGLHVTSPHPFTLQKFAKRAYQQGDEYFVLEVTSHALDQYRSWGVKFDIGVITNITHEHLDYHKTFTNYLKAKLKLINNSRVAIVNQQLLKLKDFPKNRTETLTFGLQSGDFNQREIKLKLKLKGNYNIENALAALACAYSLGVDKRIAQRSLENFQNLIGRMEEIKHKKGFKIVIDFAHTPNGLTQVLQSLRSQIKLGKLIAIFGSAGKRDVEKRYLMGQIAGKLADLVIITAEDPRGELEAINQSIIAGVKESGKTLGEDLFVIDDRQMAINFAISKLAQKNDIVGIFGKGHERSINLDGRTELPWSDRAAVNRALGIKG